MSAPLGICLIAALFTEQRELSLCRSTSLRRALRRPRDACGGLVSRRPALTIARRRPSMAQVSQLLKHEDRDNTSWSMPGPPPPRPCACQSAPITSEYQFMYKGSDHAAAPSWWRPGPPPPRLALAARRVLRPRFHLYSDIERPKHTFLVEAWSAAASPLRLPRAAAAFFGTPPPGSVDGAPGEGCRRGAACRLSHHGRI